MEVEQYFQEAVPQNEEEEASLEKWKSRSPAVGGCAKNSSAGFDCNICLEFVQDPVVTLCGHLYCWPCIYKWIHFQRDSAENPEQQCPVCKAVISQRTVVPLYGRGLTPKSRQGKAPHPGMDIPRRPPSPTCSSQASATSSYPQYHTHPDSYPATPPMLNLSGTMTTGTINPTVGMLGEMIYARIFGSSEATNLYTNTNSYQLTGSNDPRVRRHIMLADESLGRLFFFLCCCTVLCLLLF